MHALGFISTALIKPEFCQVFEGNKYIPFEKIPKDFRQQIKNDEHYIVKGNIFTKYIKDLYFSEIEVAPEPDPNDGLAPWENTDL